MDQRPPSINVRAGSLRRSISVAGPLTAVVVAAALIPLRDLIGNSNVALLLALVVVCSGALGGRLPAVLTSIVAAAVFNVWHTQPYLSFKIDSRTDAITTAMLVALGVVSGLLTERGWHERERELRRVDQLDHLCRIAELAVDSQDAEDIWPTVRDTLCHELHLGACWFEPAGVDADRSDLSFPELAHNGSLSPGSRTLRLSPNGFELPSNGVELAITSGGRRFGRLVMLPDPGHGFSLVDRRLAVAVADQFALVAARSGPLPSLW
jgi:hypothetical protein